ncbi:MAG: hypothetical protein IPP16_13845 [Acidimicrobiaceae bacterium]|nr:hypothetical protein [Acidimicrobiaceae bacterium]
MASSGTMNGPSSIAPMTAGALSSSRPKAEMVLDKMLSTMKLRVLGPPMRARS